MCEHKSLRVPGSSSQHRAVIRRVGVVGFGTMGAGIGQVSAQAGFETVGRKVNKKLCERARGTIEHFLRRAVEKGRLTASSGTPHSAG